MNTKDEKPDGKNKDGTGGVKGQDTKSGQTKNGKEARPEGRGPDREDVPYKDSLELFSSLFRAETEALTEQERRASQEPKEGSRKAGVTPPVQRSGQPRAKAPAPRTQAPRTQAPGPPAKSAPPKRPTPQGKRPAQGPPVTGPGAGQGAARGPSKPGAGGIPPKKEMIQTAPKPSLPKEEKIPTKEKRGGGRKTLRLVILLAVLVVLAAFSLYYLGIIGPAKPRHAATAVKRPHKKVQITPKVQKRPPIKVTKTAPASVKQVPVKQVQAQAAHQGPPAPEQPKAPVQQTKGASAASTSEVRKSPVPAPAAKAPQEPAAKAVAAKAPAPVAALSAYPYSVYLGSYGNRKNLKRAVSEYRGMGLSPYWVQVDLGAKGIWYRLFTGYFPSTKAAQAFIREKNIKAGERRNTRYANLIGVSRSEEELQKPRLSVEEAGFCPYMVRGPDGQWMLYTGAFYQKSRAEKQNRELRSKGIQSRLVER